MEWTIYLVLVIISAVRGEFISNFMIRNSSYDNKAFLASKLISTSHFRSVFDCAAACTKNHECKSTMFNTDTHFCQLLSAHMEAISDTTQKNTTGWVYFEKIISTYDVMPATTITSDETTEVVTLSPPSFNCSMWHLFDGHWYLLNNTLRNFNDSRTFCAGQSPSAYVIEVNSKAENDWLVELTYNRCQVPNTYWLNGYDMDDSRSVTWIHSNTTAGYTNWEFSKPSHLDEKCIVSDTLYGGEWDDILCGFLRPIVCERNS